LRCEQFEKRNQELEATVARLKREKAILLEQKADLTNRLLQQQQEHEEEKLRIWCMLTPFPFFIASLIHSFEII
jgi:hypothetical protein